MSNSICCQESFEGRDREGMKYFLKAPVYELIGLLYNILQCPLGIQNSFLLQGGLSYV